LNRRLAKPGLTRRLLAEPEEIREWLEALTSKLDQDDADSAHEEKMLVEKLGAHNGREEYALCPELDRLLSDEDKKSVFVAMTRCTAGTPGTGKNDCLQVSQCLCLFLEVMQWLSHTHNRAKSWTCGRSV
jgi:hypothetical protein